MALPSGRRSVKDQDLDTLGNNTVFLGRSKWSTVDKYMENKGERSKSRVSPLVSVHPPELEIQQRRYSNRAQHVVRVKTQGECGVLLNHSIKVGIAFEKKKKNDYGVQHIAQTCVHCCILGRTRSDVPLKRLYYRQRSKPLAGTTCNTNIKFIYLHLVKKAVPCVWRT